jgi:hypothetical protein
MGQSLSKVYVHLIFSTRDREPLLLGGLRGEMHAVQYVEDQEAHHRSLSFQDEYRRFLKQYEIEYGER